MKNIYKFFVGPILSRDKGIDAEILSKITLKILEECSLHRNTPIISFALQSISKELNILDPKLEQKLFKCNFRNPLGLAAGFDKDGIAAGIWHEFGFGFSELGTITFHPQEGNPKPRLFRLAAEQAALNRMGFNNDGAFELKQSLIKQQINLPGHRPSVIGINLGKSKITPLDKAPEDYVASLEILAPLADYAVINISSPNTPGLRNLQESSQLRRLIKRVIGIPNSPPLLIKIAPDLTNEEINNLAIVAYEEGVSGLIAVNTSLNRLGLEDRVIAQTGKQLKDELGGLSGIPLRNRALEVIQQLRKSPCKELNLIGVGGIDSAESAWERIAAGASLIQIYTGWIYQGPTLVPTILRGLLSQLEKHGFNHISEAVGSNEPWK